MKDTNLRKQLWGYWFTFSNEKGGPKMILEGKYEIDVGEGVVRHLLRVINELENKIRLLNDKIETKKDK